MKEKNTLIILKHKNHLILINLKINQENILLLKD
jgi:hypothetical protein